MPSDIRSFMVSYEEATEEKTEETREVFVEEGMDWNPKCVVEASWAGNWERRREQERQR